MGTIANRLSRLEEQRGDGNRRRNQIDEDAAFVMGRIAALAGSGHRLDAADRARWNAWSTQFLREVGRAA